MKQSLDFRLVKGRGGFLCVPCSEEAAVWLAKNAPHRTMFIGRAAVIKGHELGKALAKIQAAGWKTNLKTKN